jgi:hypothetical protein
MVSSGGGPLDQAVRVVERWGLLAAVTGLVSNALLLALYTVAQRNSAYEWTGPANDVIGAVSSGATIPVALALLTVLGESRSNATLRIATRLAIVAVALIIVLSVALVIGVIPFSVQGAAAGISVPLLFAWVLMVGRTGLTTGQLPGRLAFAAQLIGAAVLVATPLVALSLLLPGESLPQYIVGGTGLLLAVPAFAAFPIWLLLLSNRLRRHLATREGSAPELPAAV